MKKILGICLIVVMVLGISLINTIPADAESARFRKAIEQGAGEAVGRMLVRNVPHILNAVFYGDSYYGERQRPAVIRVNTRDYNGRYKYREVVEGWSFFDPGYLNVSVDCNRDFGTEGEILACKKAKTDNARDLERKRQELQRERERLAYERARIRY